MSEPRRLTEREELLLAMRTTRKLRDSIMVWRKIDDTTPYGRYLHVIDDEGLEHIATRLDVDVWSNGYAHVKAVAWLDTPPCPEDLV